MMTFCFATTAGSFLMSGLQWLNYCPLLLLVHRFDGDFCLPYCDGQYFSKARRNNVQAKEHRNLLQVLPHLLQGIDEELVEVACR